MPCAARLSPSSQSDLGEPGAFARLLDQVRPDGVVHCAALANIDACEKDPAALARA